MSRDILEEAVSIRGIWIKATCGETLPEQMTWPGRFWGGGVCRDHLQRCCLPLVQEASTQGAEQGNHCSHPTPWEAQPTLHGLACWWVGEATRNSQRCGLAAIGRYNDRSTRCWPYVGDRLAEPALGGFVQLGPTREAHRHLLAPFTTDIFSPAALQGAEQRLRNRAAWVGRRARSRLGTVARGTIAGAPITHPIRHGRGLLEEGEEGEEGAGRQGRSVAAGLQARARRKARAAA